MRINFSKYQKVKVEYLRYLKSQEILSEPFRDKIGQLNKFYLPISEEIFKNYNYDKKTKIIGLAGGQGSGKSTISQILKKVLKKAYNLKTVVFSIDDFYKTKKERKKMSKTVSPLFLTRGVPGTHDTSLLINCINGLKKNKFKKILIPKFDKSKDERFPKKNWQRVYKRPDVIIFEGWCVGVTAQKNKDLLVPVNTLEKEKDKNMIWRKRVNKELKNKYKDIFRLIDKIIFLKVPGFKYVYKWRLLQEQKLIASSRGKSIMKPSQVKSFIMFYERLTKHMLKSLSKKAEFVIKIDKKHRLKSMKTN